MQPLLGARGAGAEVFDGAQILGTLKANWLNGVAKADQKAIAKSLIRLGLTPGDAPRLAAATGVDENELTAAAQRVQDGTALTQQDINILGRFDATVSAVLDLGYERADQIYRNTTKATAALVAIILAAIGGGIIFYNDAASASPPSSASLGGYLASPLFLLSIVIGAMSTPLAPVAKDLSSSLQAAVKAVNAVRR